MRNYEVRFSTPDDADVVTHALRGFDDGAYQFLWAAVDEVLEGRDLLTDEFGSPSRFARVDREHLALWLRMGLGDHGRRMAILDTVERYWQVLNARGIKPESGGFPWPEGYDPEYPVTDPELDAMVEVGLITEGTACKYRKRRDDPDRPPPPPGPTEAELYLRDVQASAVARQVLQEATERKSKRKPRPE
jgi:hypothetical protein